MIWPKTVKNNTIYGKILLLKIYVSQRIKIVQELTENLPLAGVLGDNVDHVFRLHHLKLKKHHELNINSIYYQYYILEPKIPLK